MSMVQSPYTTRFVIYIASFRAYDKYLHIQYEEHVFKTNYPLLNVLLH